MNGSSWAFGIVTLLLSGACWAQAPLPKTFDAHGFKLVAFDGDLRDLLTVQRPGRFQSNRWFTGGILEYAHRPLVKIVTSPSGAHSEETVLLDDVVALNSSAGADVHERARVDVSLPLYFHSVDADGLGQGVALGDLRVSGMVTAFSPDAESGGLGLGFTSYLDFPTGKTSAYLGEDAAAGGGILSATYELEGFTVTGNTGFSFRKKLSLTDHEGTDSFTGALALGYVFDTQTAVNVESHFALPLGRPAWVATPAEVLFTLRHQRMNGPFFTVGGAAAISRGPGAARFRLFLGGGFGTPDVPKEPDPVDTDGDGLFDPDDPCPTEPENLNGYQDDDGCPDALAEIVVAVDFNGKPVDGAAVQARSAGREIGETTGSMPIRVGDVLPGSTWSGTAVKAPCLSGEGALTVQEGTNEWVIAVQQTLDARVTVIVVDPEGNGLESANVAWDTAGDPMCLPIEPMVLDSGRGSQSMGVGEHTVRVTADGYLPETEAVVLATGDEREIRIEMKPTKARLVGTQIVILDKVHFETGKAIIRTDSYNILNDVAAIIIGNPQVKKIEVAGHTDSEGSESFNLDLSQRRAEAVKVYLQGQGVSSGVLVPKGYGEVDPIDTNRTKAGRYNNRRVEFTVLEPASEPGNPQ